MSNEFLVPTGSIIKEYLEYEGLTQKDFSEKLGVSEIQISNLLDGKIRLTEELAMKIEQVLAPTSAAYWINYEHKYQEYISKKEESKLYNDSELKYFSKIFSFSEVFKGLDWSLQRQASEMLKLLQIPDFQNFNLVYNDLLKVDFMEDGGSKESIAVWLGLAREEIEIQNPKKLDVKTFNKKNFQKNLPKLKNIALNNDYERSLISARKLLNRLGVYLVVYEPIINSKVRGALTSYQNTPVIYISGRFKTHDNVWFALIHEVGHLLLHYVPENILITLEDDNEDNSTKELEANQFARDFFISQHEYEKFRIENTHGFTEASIREFAISQNILPGIVVGRLQHDNILSYSMFSKLKDRKLF